MNKHQEGTNRGRTVAGHRVGFVMDWAWKQDRTQQDIFKVCKLDIVVLGHWGMDWTGWQDRFIGGIGLAYKTLSRFEKVKKTRIVFFFPPYSLS